MAKKVTAYIKLQVGAGNANPAPPVGPALGQHGVNIMEFCKAFNAHTAKLEKGAPVPVVITVYQDALNIQSASHKPGKESAGKITHAQLLEIAKTKEPDMTGADLEASARSIGGTARSMGIQVED